MRSIECYTLNKFRMKDRIQSYSVLSMKLALELSKEIVLVV